MNIIECEQNTPEWYAARLGKATASNFSRIITPLGKESKSADGYADEILAEILVGHSIEGFSSKYMERGKELESDAALQFASLVDEQVIKAGFCVTDCGRFGCSVDRLVGDNAILETKVLKPANHVAQLLEPSIDIDHKPQTQGQLLICKRKISYSMSYHPEMDPVIIPTERDEPYIAELERLLEKFDQILKRKINILISKGHMKV